MNGLKPFKNYLSDHFKNYQYGPIKEQMHFLLGHCVQLLAKKSS